MIFSYYLGIRLYEKNWNLQFSSRWKEHQSTQNYDPGHDRYQRRIDQDSIAKARNQQRLLASFTF